MRLGSNKPPTPRKMAALWSHDKLKRHDVVVLLFVGLRAILRGRN